MIPKIIHHVWPGADPFKEKFYNFRLSWMKNHPDWTFYFWRLDNLPQEFNEEIKEILFNTAYSVTPKSDLLRFEILRLFGGIYVDTDMESIKSIECFTDLDFFTGYEDNKGTICPSLIGSVSNHDILSIVIEKSLYNVKNNSIEYTNRKPNIVTGVQPFTETVTEFIPNDNIKVFSKDYFYPIYYKEKDKLYLETPDSFVKHHWSGMDPDGWVNQRNFSL